MTRNAWSSLLISLVLMLFLVSCGNTTEDDSATDGDRTEDGDESADGDESSDGDEEAVMDGDEAEDGDAVTDGDQAEDGDEIVDGDAEMEEEASPEVLCGEIAFEMHQSSSGQVFVRVTDMSAHYEDVGEYDFVFAKVHGQGPTGYLGDGVTAVNAGSDVAFDSYNEAPADGYSEDGEAPVIGTSWQNGGSGSEGFVVTGNVYVLKLKDGTFAKISITFAKDGAVTLDAFHQADGSRNLMCSFE